MGALKVRTSTGPDVWATIGGIAPVVELTQAAYDALGTKDPGTMYVITDGADRTLLTGTGAPTAGDGINGDFWINTTSWLIYGPKAAGAWPSGVSLVGPTGAASAGAGAFFGFDFDTTTTAGPASTRLRINNATPASATIVYVSYTSKDNVDLKTRLLAGTAGDRLYIQEKSNSANYRVYELTGAPVDGTTYATCNVVHRAGGGSLWANSAGLMAGFTSPPTTVGTTAPASPLVNDIWIDTT